MIRTNAAEKIENIYEVKFTSFFAVPWEFLKKLK